MSGFPLGFSDLSLFAAIVAIILIVTSELLSPYYARTELAIDRKRLHTVAFIVSMIFIATVALRVYEVIVSA